MELGFGSTPENIGMFFAMIKLKLVNGQFLFWHDTWTDHTPLQDQFPDLLNMLMPLGTSLDG